jgi:hypothetical protein
MAMVIFETEKSSDLQSENCNLNWKDVRQDTSKSSSRTEEKSWSFSNWKFSSFSWRYFEGYSSRTKVY